MDNTVNRDIDTDTRRLSVRMAARVKPGDLLKQATSETPRLATADPPMIQTRCSRAVSLICSTPPNCRSAAFRASCGDMPAAMLRSINLSEMLSKLFGHFCFGGSSFERAQA